MRARALVIKSVTAAYVPRPAFAAKTLTVSWDGFATTPCVSQHVSKMRTARVNSSARMDTAAYLMDQRENATTIDLASPTRSAGQTTSAKNQIVAVAIWTALGSDIVIVALAQIPVMRRPTAVLDRHATEIAALT